jgi:ketosteroid isomerase-like protein
MPEPLLRQGAPATRHWHRAWTGGILRDVSEADFEALRRGYEAFNQRDLDGLVELFDPDAVWIPSSSVWGAGNAYRGHEGVRRLLDDVAHDWKVFEARPQQYRQVGDLILVLGEVRAVPRSGGHEINSTTGWIWELREGKALRLQAYTDPERALEALGVSE